MSFSTRSEQRCWGGVQGCYEHESAACGGPMRFAVFRPKGEGPFPALYYLAGLTCTEETFVIKAGAQRLASDLGIALVACDTSPRASRYPGDDDAWDFGIGAGFYVDATQAPWSATYRMATYVTEELPRLVEQRFAIRHGVRGIFGHSMGGHGALALALRHPKLYRSVSALAPIVAPSQVPWGQKAFNAYLGPDHKMWAEYDSCALMTSRGWARDILIDQGDADEFLKPQLRPELFAEACKAKHVPLTLRMQAGYDHSYYFMSTFIGDHVRWHAERLHAS